MALPRPSRHSVGWADLRAFLTERRRHPWAAGVLAVAIPIAILAAFYVDSYMHALPRPQIVYINSWPADRSDAEIRARQQADLARREAIEAERQRQFQRLEKQAERLGI